MADAVTQAWGEWIAAQGPWHVFGGLTYDPAMRRRDAAGGPTAPGSDPIRAHARLWLRESDKALGHRLEAAVVALEYQKSGWPHLHPLLRLAGGLQGAEFKTIGQLWFRRHGYAKLEEPLSQDDVSAYASKYLVKDLARGDVTFWPLRGGWPAHQEGLIGNAYDKA
jgi:hypothetical protein